jgi:hypothetical protein
LPNHAGDAPQVNAREITLSYGSQQSILALPPGGGEVGALRTFDFYLEIYQRNSIDGNGLPLNAIVHYGRNYDNAFWDGQQMVFGDGDKTVFNRFTVSLDGGDVGALRVTAGDGPAGRMLKLVGRLERHDRRPAAELSPWLVDLQPN